MDIPNVADITRRWAGCLEVLRSILLGITPRIKLQRFNSKAEFYQMVNTMEHIVTLLGEEPYLSQLDSDGRESLLRGMTQVILVHEEIEMLLHHEREGEEAEPWRYIAALAVIENAGASLLLASEALT